MMRLIAQREQFAYRVAAPTRMYRGLNLDTTAPGMEKVHSILSGGDWDHPELGGHILDWLKNGPRQGLGTHWTTDPTQAERFARWPNEETGRGGNLQAVIEGDWHGDNEDHGRTDTREFDELGNRIRAFPQERETTLLPGANLNVTGLRIRPYDDEYWNGPAEPGQEIDENHEGPWHEVFKGSRAHTAGLTPNDMDNLTWDWAKGKWAPRRNPEDPLIPHREERAFDYDRDWPGWRGATLTPSNRVAVPDVPEPHTYLPTTEVARYNRERLRMSDPYTRTKMDRLDQQGGPIQRPIDVVTDGSRAVIGDGNHRTQWAKEHGVEQVPVRFHRVTPEEWDLSRDYRSSRMGPGMADWLKTNPGVIKDWYGSPEESYAIWGDRS